MEYANLMAYIDANYEEIEDAVFADLENTNEEYRDLLHDSSEMDQKYPSIWQALYGEGDLSLTAMEHAALFEYLMMENEIHDIERRAIYMQGLKDAAALAEKFRQ